MLYEVITDALGGDLVVGDGHAVGHGHEDGQLMGGVDTFDVIGVITSYSIHYTKLYELL